MHWYTLSYCDKMIGNTNVDREDNWTVGQWARVVGENSCIRHLATLITKLMEHCSLIRGQQYALPKCSLWLLDLLLSLNRYTNTICDNHNIHLYFTFSHNSQVVDPKRLLYSGHLKDSRYSSLTLNIVFTLISFEYFQLTTVNKSETNLQSL